MSYACTVRDDDSHSTMSHLEAGANVFFNEEASCHFVRRSASVSSRARQTVMRCQQLEKQTLLSILASTALHNILHLNEKLEIGSNLYFYVKRIHFEKKM
ncbi:hypothetical protein D918_03533 [Trichuris suis]|nr:hypothetical protein D918_03533 [Trichuris suis]